MSDAESFTANEQKMADGAESSPEQPGSAGLDSAALEPVVREAGEALPPSIDYSEAAIEKIREQVWDGFRRFSRGGLEVGGILYGFREERTLTIQEVQPIACEHASGPGFVLSESDLAALQEQIRRDSQEPRFQGMACLGWFVSHTRSGLALSAGELKFYSDFFPEPWQITLLVRPEPDGDTRGAFFGRESDGSVRTDSNGREFSFPARPAPIARRKEGWRQGNSAEPIPRPPLTFHAQPANTQPSAEPMSYSLLSGRAAAPGWRVKWTWLAVWGLLLVGVALLATRWVRADRSPQPISLALIERDGQLQIEWDRGARPVAKAVRGSLEIADGSGTQRIALTPQDLAAGVLTYERKSGDVEVRMRVEEAGGRAVEEASRYLGNPPGQKADPAEIDALTQQRDGLEVELKRVRGENAAQAERIRQLETMLRSLEERLGVK